MTQLFIGCDMSKHFFDVTYRDKAGHYIYLGQFINEAKGFKELVKQLKSVSKLPKSQWFVCFENTGSYSKALFKFFCEKSIPRREEIAAQISKSLGIKRGKNDKVDSKDICKYLYQRRDTIRPNVLDDSQISQLKKLLSYRDQLVKYKVGLSVGLKDINPNLEKDFVTELQGLNNPLIKKLKKSIKDVESKIAKLIASDEELNQTNKLVTSVVGIGHITSAYMIAYSDNFKAFFDPRKFACYAGIAPFENSSGLFKGKNKVSNIANKKIKSILSQCAMSAVLNDPQISAYYNRKKGQNKHYGIVMNAIKNKLVQRVFAVVKRKSPYLKLQAYA